MAYKTVYMKTSLPIFLQNQYIHKDNICLRNKNDVIIKYYRTVKGQKFVYHTIATERNKLPFHLKINHHIGSFKKILKAYLIRDR